MLLKLLIFAFLGQIIAQQNKTCEGGTESLNWTLPNSFKAFINAESTDKLHKLFYYRQDASHAVYHTEEYIIFIVDDAQVKTINGSECKVQKRPEFKSDLYPLLINRTMAKDKSLVLTMDDLHKVLLNFKYNKNNTEYNTCTIVDSNNINITVMMSGATVEQIKIAVYGNDSADVPSAWYTFKFFGFGEKLTEEESQKLLPPLGIDCKVGTLLNIPAEFPDTFSVRIDYTDPMNSILASSQVYFDSKQQLTAFDYEKVLKYQPIAAHDLQLKTGSYWIIHDFTTGLQYIVNKTDSTCTNLTSLPLLAGDVKKIDNSSSVIDMNDVFETLFSPLSLNYTLVGKRYLNDMPAEVYIASSNAAGEYTTREIWILQNAKSASTMKFTPAAVRVYLMNTSGPILLSQQQFHDYSNYDDKVPTTFYYAGASPCLYFAGNSSSFVVQFSVNYKNQKLNQFVLIEILRAKLAAMANVSVVRFDKFFIEPVNDTQLYIFFTLAEQSGVNGTVTKHFVPEISAVEAAASLNASLRKDWTFDVQGVKLSLIKDSLNFVPPMFHANNVTNIVVNTLQGYTGGSMAVMAFFMLIIGVVGGFSLAYFLWKRNRGIQYQIYE